MSNKPVQTFRDGQIAASVWERAGSRGQYFEFTLSRSFQRCKEEGFGYSPCFRSRDVKALKQCIEKAAIWISATDALAGRDVEPENEGQLMPPAEGCEPCDL